MHSFKRVNIGDGEFRVVYSTDKVRIGMNLGILRVRDGEFILYDKDRVELLHQPVSDVKAEPSYLKPYPVKITSLTDSWPMRIIEMAEFHGLKPKQGWQSMRAFEAALNEQGGQFGSDTPGSKA